MQWLVACCLLLPVPQSLECHCPAASPRRNCGCYPCHNTSRGFTCLRRTPLPLSVCRGVFLSSRFLKISESLHRSGGLSSSLGKKCIRISCVVDIAAISIAILLRYPQDDRHRCTTILGLPVQILWCPVAWTRRVCPVLSCPLSAFLAIFHFYFRSVLCRGPRVLCAL